MQMNILQIPHNDLTLPEQKTKIIYINELLLKDTDFDLKVREAMENALQKNPPLSKVIDLNQMDSLAILDMTHPLE